MDFTQILTSLFILLISGSLSTVLAVKITQAVMNEKLKNIQKDLESHLTTSADDIDKLRSDVSDSIKGCKINASEKIEVAMDYIKRVEINKADRSEVNLLIDSTKRIEQKLDLLIRDMTTK